MHARGMHEYTPTLRNSRMQQHFSPELIQIATTWRAGSTLILRSSSQQNDAMRIVCLYFSFYATAMSDVYRSQRHFEVEAKPHPHTCK